jgi:hypothetical protein
MTASTVSTATVTLTPQGSTTPVAAAVSYDAASRMATLDPTANLTAGITYTATVKGGASGVTDLAGNPLASDVTWAYSTAPDTTAPTVTAVSPAAGATKVSVGATVTATFSEPMNASTVTTTTVTLVRAGTTTPIAAVVTYDSVARRVTLTPSARLASATSYTATVKGGSAGVKDEAGNPLASDRAWTFTTR